MEYWKIGIVEYWNNGTNYKLEKWNSGTMEYWIQYFSAPSVASAR